MMRRHPVIARFAAEESNEEDEYGNEDSIEVNDVIGNEPTEHIQQLARKLVRYALSCESSRTPIRRQEISTKIMSSGPKQFKHVFKEAQNMLSEVFGMEMTELPKVEKYTIQQKRAAQKSEKAASASSNSWVLTNVLPEKFRTPEILSPSRAPNIEQESTYIGFYSLVVALIYLSGGSLSETKLDRYLRRTNLQVDTTIGRTDKLMSRLIKDGYIVKVKNISSGDEELVDYFVGPRGKVEVGPHGARKLARLIWPEQQEDPEQMLDRTLAYTNVEELLPSHASTQAKVRGRPKKVAVEDDSLPCTDLYGPDDDDDHDNDHDNYEDNDQG